MKQLALVLAIAACGGKSGGTTADAPPVADAAPDAPSTGVVSVTVVLNAVPTAGATVFFSDATGHLITSSTTGADGKGSATVAAGSSVTCELTGGTPGSLAHLIETTFDVQPGDEIVCGLPAPVTTSSPQGTVQVTLPGVYAGAAFYSVDMGGCSSNNATAAPMSVALNTTCVASTNTFDALALAKDSSSGSMLAYATSLGLTPPGAGKSSNVTMPSWRTDFGVHNIAVSNAPPNAELATTFGLSHDTAAWNIDGSTATTSAAGGAAVSFPYPMSIGTSVSYTVQVDYPPSLGARPTQQYIVREPPSSLQDEALDFGTLPALLSRAAYVLDRHTTPVVSWAAADSLATTTGGATTLVWTTPGEQWVWAAAVPSSATSVQFPDLPDSLAGDRVTPSQPYDQVVVVFVEGTMFAGPADFRSHWANIIGEPPSSGTYAERMTAIY
jgi:hypothetical protein